VSVAIVDNSPHVDLCSTSPEEAVSVTGWETVRGDLQQEVLNTHTVITNDGITHS